MMPIKLQVLICTYQASGLARVAEMALPHVDGVQYLVSCQSEPIPLPEALTREDVKVDFTSSIGLSNNRNNALALATAPYVLIADDDLIFYADALSRIIDVLDSDPDLDIAAFRCKMPYTKVYPKRVHDLSKKYKNYNIASCEIALRTASIKKSGIRFSPLLGIGAEYLKAAEENVFILSCLRHGLVGRFFPITISSHPHETTGTRDVCVPGVVRANGAYILLAYPMTAILRIPLVAYRTKGSTLHNIKLLLQGAIYAALHRHRLLNP